MSLGALSPKRIKKYRYILKKISKLLAKDLDNVRKQDIVKIMANSSDLQDRTKRDYRLVIKRFFFG